MPNLTLYRNENRINNNVQSILISRNHYTRNQVPFIINHLGYNLNRIDTSKDYFRVRQFNPGSFRKNPKYITVSSKIIPYVKMVIEY